MKRSAQAVWQGGGKDGKGQLTTDSKVLDSSPYSFSTRFESAKGTNPEELVAAAHAGCFSMALAFGLAGAGFSPQRIETRATVTIENQGAQGWGITSSHLEVRASVPGLDESRFRELAESAKANCPISKLLKAPITMSAELAASQAA